MMREILFRGKLVDDEEWVEGYYAHIKDVWKGRESHRIYSGTAETDCGEFYEDFFEVDPSTVGEYTGLTDKNGKKIFEGDIVKLQMPGYEMNGQIIFEEATFYIMEDDVCEVLWYEEAKFEVIGNIHDNPELLEN